MLRRHRAGSKGQSLVEFALVLPVLLLVVLGILDFGRAIYAYTTVADAARQANRTAIVDQTTATVQNQAIRSSPTLAMQASDVHICYYVATTTQTSCAASPVFVDQCSNPVSTPLTIGCLAFVTTVTTFSPITPIISSIVPSITLSSTSVGPIENVCPTTTHPTCP